MREVSDESADEVESAKKLNPCEISADLASETGSSYDIFNDNSSIEDPD